MNIRQATALIAFYDAQGLTFSDGHPEHEAALLSLVKVAERKLQSIRRKPAKPNLITR